MNQPLKFIAQPLLLLTICVAGDQSPSRSRGSAALPVDASRPVTFRLIRESELPSRDAGSIQEIRVSEGEEVRKGQLLLVLASDEQELAVQARQLALRIAQLKAEDDLGLKSASAQLEEVKAAKNLASIRLEIAEAEAQSSAAVEIAEAETRLRQMELDRAQSARESFRSSISETHIDRLKTSVEKGRLETTQAKENHDVKAMKPRAEKATVLQKQQEIARYETLVAQEQASRVVAELTQEVQENELKIAETRLERRYVRAPFDGVLMRVDVNPGEWVEIGAPVARLIDVSRLRAEGFVRAIDAGDDLIGRPVQIDVVAGAETFSVEGRITFVGREVDPQNQEVRFYAEVQNADGRLLPGMHGQLSIGK